MRAYIQIEPDDDVSEEEVEEEVAQVLEQRYGATYEIWDQVENQFAVICFDLDDLVNTSVALRNELRSVMDSKARIGEPSDNTEEDALSHLERAEMIYSRCLEQVQAEVERLRRIQEVHQ